MSKNPINADVQARCICMSLYEGNTYPQLIKETWRGVSITGMDGYVEAAKVTKAKSYEYTFRVIRNVLGTYY